MVELLSEIPLEPSVTAPFNVLARFDGRTGIVTLRGELDLATLPKLETVLSWMRPRVDVVVFETAELTFIDLASLRLIMSLVDSGCEPWIRTPSRFLRRVVEVIGHEHIFVHPSERDGHTKQVATV